MKFFNILRYKSSQNISDVFRPMKLLRKLPPLNSRKVIALSVSFLRKIPQDVYTLLAGHAWDDSLGSRIDQLHASLE